MLTTTFQVPHANFDQFDLYYAQTNQTKCYGFHMLIQTLGFFKLQLMNILLFSVKKCQDFARWKAARNRLELYSQALWPNSKEELVAANKLTNKHVNFGNHFIVGGS